MRDGPQKDAVSLGLAWSHPFLSFSDDNEGDGGSEGNEGNDGPVQAKPKRDQKIFAVQEMETRLTEEQAR